MRKVARFSLPVRWDPYMPTLIPHHLILPAALGFSCSGAGTVQTFGRFIADSSPPHRVHTGAEKLVLDDEGWQVSGSSAGSLCCLDGERARVAPVFLLNSRPILSCCIPSSVTRAQKRSSVGFVLSKRHLSANHYTRLRACADRRVANVPMGDREPVS